MIQRENLNKILSDKIILVKADNGVILTDTNKTDNAVKVYQIFNEDGSVNFESFTNMIQDIAEFMNIPFEDPISGLGLVNYTMPINEINNLDDLDDTEE